MKFLILNGPNLNLLGYREPEIYGNESFDAYFVSLSNKFTDCVLIYKQTNIEGEFIDELHKSLKTFDGIIINPGAYSHYSIAIADAIKSINIPIIEVHISNVFARESYRHTLLTASNCIGCISGLGFKGYELAIYYLIDFISKKNN